MGNVPKFSLIICTYMRAKVIVDLLISVKNQTVYPDEILIIDASTNDETKVILEQNFYQNLMYFSVDEQHRGLTKQRNFGIRKVKSQSEIICFLDDDVILESDYFKNLLATYELFPQALGVGGYIINESKWNFVGANYNPKRNEFYFDNWVRKDGQRFVLRKLFGLDSDSNPGLMPSFSHGRSLSFLPPSNKIYEVEQLMGGVSSFRKSVFDAFKFSIFFEGYGLYEDADFTLRVSKTGKLYCNTSAKLSHYHHNSGRPNSFKYGKMVVVNGWYVWRVKYPNPNFNARLKWNNTVLLLTLIRFTNVFSSSKPKEALLETLGRISGWLSLLFTKPKIRN